MIRKQVYFTDDQVRDIKIRAKREGRHEAEVIREAVSAGLQSSQPTPKVSTGESLLRLARIGAKGSGNLSSRLDDLLYGEDR